MLTDYKTIYREGRGEVVAKKSRFLSVAVHVGSEEEAIAFIEAVKKEHRDARHNCYAYIIRGEQEIRRFSDDGEPSQTAGTPMLEVLAGKELFDVAVVVTRYFGGTLLGTGGLIRAYSKAVQEALEDAVIIEKRLAQKLKIETDYNGIGKIQYLLKQAGIDPIDTEYTDKVVITAAIPMEQLQKLEKDMIEKTDGRVNIKKEAQVYYAEADGEVILL